MGDLVYAQVQKCIKMFDMGQFSYVLSLHNEDLEVKIE